MTTLLRVKPCWNFLTVLFIFLFSPKPKLKEWQFFVSVTELTWRPTYLRLKLASHAKASKTEPLVHLDCFLLTFMATSKSSSWRSLRYMLVLRITLPPHSPLTRTASCSLMSRSREHHKDVLPARWSNHHWRTLLHAQSRPKRALLCGPPALHCLTTAKWSLDYRAVER